MDDDKRLRAETRRMFRNVFTSEDGRIVLHNILYNLGYYETDSSRIKPELIAFANRLLHDIGINARGNERRLIDAVVDAATDTDIYGTEV